MKNLFVISTFCIVLLTSCATVYRPNMTATPLLTQKRQVAVEGAYSRDGINVSAAAAVAPAVSIMINGQYNKNTQRNGGLFDSTPSNGSYGEFGLGYFKKIQENFIVETYVGFGKGHLNDKMQTINEKYEESLKYNKIFVQPNFAWRAAKNFDLIFTPRLGYVKGNYVGSNSEIVNGVEQTAKVGFLTLEPTLTFAFGIEKFKFYLQGGLNTTYNTHEANDRLKYNSITSLYNIGAGVKYTFRP